MESKICPVCKQPFVRNPAYSNAQWDNAKHCSRECAHRRAQRRKQIRCKLCGTSLIVHRKSPQQFCSRACANQWKSLYPSKPIPAQMHTPKAKKAAIAARQSWYASRRKTLYCELCEKSFVVPKSSRRRFCCRACKDRWWSLQHQRTKLCPVCNQPFTYSPTRCPIPRIYCSRVCYSTTLAGSGNPNWKGGPNYYGPDWRQIAADIRARDLVCQDCGNPPAENSGLLQVHHIIPIREFSSHTEANQPDNLKALCFACHRKYQERDY